jgi:hypothetical protein
MRSLQVIRPRSAWIAISFVMLTLSGVFRARTVIAAGTAQRTNAARNAEAVAAFEAMVPVLRHPRCLNCHSRGDFPRQGDDHRPHAMNVRRGLDGKGVTAQKCSACHQEHNTAGLNMPPGAHEWQLPPRNMPMVWEGLTNRQLCELLKDPKRNGYRTKLDQIVQHTQTPLVAWGWHPGEGRVAIPGTHAEFVAKVRQWVDGGGACPD